MIRVLKFLIFLAIVGFAVLSGYAYLGDLSPQTRDIVEPVTLDAN